MSLHLARTTNFGMHVNREDLENVEKVWNPAPAVVGRDDTHTVVAIVPSQRAGDRES